MPKIAALTRAWAGTILGALVLSGVVVDRAWAADDGPICANRPGKGTPTCTVGPGRVQVEVGAYDVSTSDTNAASTNTYAVGAFQVRLGLTESAEIQASLTPYTLIRQTDKTTGIRTRTYGVGDVTIGVRQSIALTNTVSVAIQPFVTAPTGRTGIGSGGWQGGVVLPLAISLNSTTGFGIAPEVDYRLNKAGNGRHVAYTALVGINHAFGEVTLGAELWGSYDDDPSGATTQASADFTAAWIPKRLQHTQFDFGVNKGLNHNTPDLETYVGVSQKF